MKSMLDLDYQLDRIDYHQKNFVHADMTPEDRQAMIQTMVSGLEARLMKDGAGGKYTHPDHPALSSQLYAAYARAVQARVLASVVGEEGLADTDRRYLRFGTDFESTGSCRCLHPSGCLDRVYWVWLAFRVGKKRHEHDSWRARQRACGLRFRKRGAAAR